MYLHVGQAVMIREAEIIAIFDIGLLNQSDETKQFFSRLRAQDLVEGDPRRAKSMIVTEKKIYLSKISPSTLARRGRSHRLARVSEER